MFKSALLAVDGSDGNLAAVKAAAALSATYDTELVVVTVAMAATGRGGFVAPSEEEIDEILFKARSTIEESGGKVRRSIGVYAGMRGPAHEIIETAKSEGVDLIITGNRGHAAWTGLALGSISQRVLGHAPCPVLVVPAT